MPELVEAIQETLPLDGQTPDLQSLDGSVPTKDTTPAKTLIFGKYKDTTEAEKGFKELEKDRGRLADELGKTRSELDMARRQEKLEAAVEAIARSKEVPKDEQADFEKFVEEVSGEWIDNPKIAVKRMATLYNDWLSISEKKHSTKIEELEKKFSEFSSRTAENMERMSPEYQQNKYLIDKMVAKGMSLSDARSLVGELMQADPDAPVRLERATQPSAIAPTRVIPTQTTPASAKYMFTTEDLDILRDEFPKLTEAELKTLAIEMNAKRKDRLASGQPTSETIYRRSA
jgi:polyhydroxyalkanoate synthesis regulator phasin